MRTPPLRLTATGLGELIFLAAVAPRDKRDRASRQLEILAARSLDLADRVKAREIEFIDAVDLAYEAACWSGLTETVGNDLVQTVLATAFAQVPRGCGKNLRPHQVRLLEQLDAALAAGCRRIVVQAPTGFGKTIVAAHRLRMLQDAGKRAIFIVPALSLIDQSVEKLYAEGVQRRRRDPGQSPAHQLRAADPSRQGADLATPRGAAGG